jgi:hypothetical protein
VVSKPNYIPPKPYSHLLIGQHQSKKWGKFQTKRISDSQNIRVFENEKMIFFNVYMALSLVLFALKTSN